MHEGFASQITPRSHHAWLRRWLLSRCSRASPPTSLTVSSRLAVQVATHQVYEYIGASNAWVAKAPMRDSRFRFNAAFASEAVYAFGGSSTSICTSPGMPACVMQISALRLPW